MTPEQTALVSKAHASLNAARLLADGDFHGFAASRAYYAMLYVAQAFLLGDGLSFSKHSAVIAAFGQYFAKTGRVPSHFHRYLIEGEGFRSIGDYDIAQDVSAEDAATQIDRAEELLAFAEGSM